MINRFHLKYQKILDILEDVAACADQKLILVGGTALALFHLKHRISVDLDFVVIQGDDVKSKEQLKGCITKKGYKTTRGALLNQFIIQFEETSIKIEIFSSEYKIRKIEKFDFGIHKLLVASVDDILNMKIEAYKERKKARDLYDILIILKHKNADFGLVKQLIAECGKPVDTEDLDSLDIKEEDQKLFFKVLDDVPQTSS